MAVLHDVQLIVFVLLGGIAGYVASQNFKDKGASAPFLLFNTMNHYLRFFIALVILCASQRKGRTIWL
ncbi:hypothetical protein AL545_16505 [Vibrio alginolyticus]|nr:hypothetical protein AL545_16505 [Vibrio alginolyticus]